MAIQTFHYPSEHNARYIKKEILTHEETSKFLNINNSENIIYSISEDNDITYYLNTMLGDDLHTEELQRMLFWFIKHTPETFLNYMFYDLYKIEKITLHIITNLNNDSDINLINYHYIIKLIACDKTEKYYLVETYQNLQTI